MRTMGAFLFDFNMCRQFNTGKCLRLQKPINFIRTGRYRPVVQSYHYHEGYKEFNNAILIIALVNDLNSEAHHIPLAPDLAQ